MKPLDFPSHHGPANELLNHIRSCYIPFVKVRLSKQIFEARATISNSESDPLSRHAEKTSSRRTIFNPSIPKAKRIIYESDRIEANVNLQLMMCLLLLCVCFLCHVYQVVWHCLVHSLEQTWIRLNRILKGTCTPFYFIPSNGIAMWLDDLRSDFMASCERCQPICWFDFEMTYVLKTYAQVRISHRASELVRGPRDLIAWVRSVLISHEEEA